MPQVFADKGVKPSVVETVRRQAEKAKVDLLGEPAARAARHRRPSRWAGRRCFVQVVNDGPGRTWMVGVLDGSETGDAVSGLATGGGV